MLRSFFSKFFDTPELVFAVAAGCFGLVLAFVNPLGSLPDEFSHFNRAYNISEGRLFPPERRENTDGQGAWSATYSMPRALVPFTWENCGYIECDRFLSSGETDLFSDELRRSIFTDRVDFSDRVDVLAPSAEAYFPVPHMPQALGVLVGRLIYPSAGVMFVAGRLANLAFYIVAMFFIIRWAMRGKWVYVLVAAAPVPLALAASNSADAMYFVGCFGVVVLVQNLFVSRKTICMKSLAPALGLGLLATLTKMNSVVLLLPLLALPAQRFSLTQSRSVKRRGVSVQLRKWIMVLGLLILVAGVGALWMVVASRMMGYIWANDADMGAQLGWVLDNPFEYVKVLLRTFFVRHEATGTLTLFAFIDSALLTLSRVPLAIYVGFFAVLLAVYFYDDKQVKAAATSKSEVVAALVTAMAFVVTTATALYLGWTVVGHERVIGLQGRYFVVLFPIMIPVLLWLQRYAVFKMKSRILLGGGVCVLLVIVLLLSIMSIVGMRS
ncbi:DUF2142 domain-containing protein [Candidatus Saccharibacteria bacterium]|nr:DUF2142 domain-containing protein [Candidatus Saccharibacteria bacterium]